MKEFDAYLNSLQKLPHLIILGAGATKAVIPDGDRYGKKTACMGNFIKELTLDHILTDHQIIELTPTKLVYARLLSSGRFARYTYERN